MENANRAKASLESGAGSHSVGRCPVPIKKSQWLPVSTVSMETRRKMVEGLDELLQTLECDDRKTSKRAETLCWSELSLDISDILTLDLDDSSAGASASREPATAEKIKCCPTFVSGTDVAPKFTSSSAFRTCSALHCRDCDFPVSTFPGYEWTEHVEYLFLRTNMPDFEKLLAKLTRRTGTVAYACHCVSFTAEKLTPLHETNLPWFCRGHF